MASSVSSSTLSRALGLNYTGKLPLCSAMKLLSSGNCYFCMSVSPVDGSFICAARFMLVYKFFCRFRSWV